MPLFGYGSANAGPAPSTPFAVGVRQYNWTRGTRQVTTFVYYPAVGTPGGNPITNAPVASGVFPICEYTHGSGASPQRALAHIRPLAAAGFIVPAPVFTNASIGDTYNGNLPRDVSEAITRTIALNTGSDPLAGHINTAAVGVSGYSMGGMTTHALLTAYPDSRIKAAVPISCVDMGTPSSMVKANVMFIHGDRDATCPYSSARQAYSELPPTKAFLTFIGADHSGTSWGTTNTVAIRTWLDWMRWSLYGDLAARDRLPADAASSYSRWEFVAGTEVPPARYEAETAPAVCQGTIDSNHSGFSGTGFCNGTNAIGAYSQVTANATAAGTATLAIRFANGAETRPADLIVNGTTVATVSFENTGAWTTWSTRTLTAALNAGSNTVRLAPTTAAGLPNIDFIEVS
ncbi:carbohydrate-binding protein [Allorhizocola rhizosphaerae]|uniref:poly(ethylene terephthalate) hydrolase family protein n=1 Tax=Allorhizocola rhizosphaerae TaxID=1872709 RepID=UPI001FE7FC77|nr:carbohydrate-binding protein [Allorhizocola rhizosphaerae]